MEEHTYPTALIAREHILPLLKKWKCDEAKRNPDSWRQKKRINTGVACPSWKSLMRYKVACFLLDPDWSHNWWKLLSKRVSLDTWLLNPVVEDTRKDTGRPPQFSFRLGGGGVSEVKLFWLLQLYHKMLLIFTHWTLKSLIYNIIWILKKRHSTNVLLFVSDNVVLCLLYYTFSAHQML